MIAETARDTWHGQRGGFKAFALTLDPDAFWYRFMPIYRNSIWPITYCFHFSDNSKLLVSGRGKNHKREVL